MTRYDYGAVGFISGEDVLGADISVNETKGVEVVDPKHQVLKEFCGLLVLAVELDDVLEGGLAVRVEVIELGGCVKGALSAVKVAALDLSADLAHLVVVPKLLKSLGVPGHLVEVQHYMLVVIGTISVYMLDVGIVINV